MIIRNLNPYIKDVEEILYQVFKPFYPEATPDWFKQQIQGIELSLSLGFLKNNKLVAIYLLTEENYENLSGRGIHGEALAVLSEYRGQKIAEHFFQYIKDNYSHDYLWGRQAKALNNLPFWLRHRTLLKEEPHHYFTIQKLK